MKKIFKKIIIYILIFIMVLSTLILLLYASSLIKKQAIKDNLVESIPFYEKNKGIEPITETRDYTLLHYFADTVVLNILYSIDSDKPIESMLYAKYFKRYNADVNYDFIETVKNDREPNESYLRYWHGSIVILRPLLTLFNMEQIYLLNKIIMFILCYIMFLVLWLKNKKIALIFIISLLIVSFQVVPFCFEYSWTFYIMFISSMIAINIEKGGNSNLYKLFFITGMVTCFFDFLSTEIITVFVPVLLVLLLRKDREKNIKFKDAILFVIISALLWGIGYVSMWLSKWIISAIILKINVVEYVKDNLLLRINGLQGIKTKKEMYLGALSRNFNNLWPIALEKNKKALIIKSIIITLTVLIFTDWKNIRKKSFSIVLLLIAIMPYIRYLVLANHSYRHAFFTFRSQIITCIAIFALIINNIGIERFTTKWRKFWKKLN